LKLTRTFGIGGALALALLFAAPAADAATVGVNVGADGVAEYTYTAAPAETNAVRVTESQTTLAFQDDYAPLHAGSGCQNAGDQLVTCLVPAGSSRLVVNLGDGDDAVDAEGLRYGGAFALNGNRFDGGAGNDELYGSPGNDQIVGGPGNDRMAGFEGNDTLMARDRPDGITTTPSTDPYRDAGDCGDGTDTFVGDASDVLTTSHGCETIDVPTSNVPRPSFSFAGGYPKVKHGVIGVAVGCSAFTADGCSGELRLLYRSTVVATANVKLASGKSKMTRLKLGSAGKKLAKKKSALRVKLVAIVAGKQTTLTTLVVQTR
jgi:hypothetical protein